MKQPELASPARHNIQDHYSIAVKERDWSLFLFFRILSNAEVEKWLEIERSIPSFEILDIEELVKADFAVIDEKALAFDDPPGLLDGLADAPKPKLHKSYFLAFLERLLGSGKHDDLPDIEAILAALHLSMPKGPTAQDRANQSFENGLVGICVHEALRYVHTDHALPLLRAHPDAEAARILREADCADRYSNAPVNLAFTHSGLGALKKVEGSKEMPVINKDALSSFPDAFRRGMAARAKSLGDTGRSAPENWEGELGKPSIHGMLTAYFKVSTEQFEHWDKVRKQVEAFNTGDLENADNRNLRRILRRLFLLFGFEILHIELGQTPYKLPCGEDGPISKLTIRKEHFGFRDGISQPFVDLGLNTPLPGGGTPTKDGTWAPVAAGEIFLGEPDEDGLTADQPVNQTLRDGGTYLVFRKLEQDVAGFRSYLEHKRQTPPERDQLAAQFVGRWPDGAPLVRHPDFDASYIGKDRENALNDFRYRTEDPRGVKCPIGAHIRRTNPRDTGGRNETRYHRILRRSMSYGGPLLPEGSKGDGRRRGLLFVAANARIEMQFEVIQRDWINSGEILGQVGADRCPLTGANSGMPQDRFLEAGAVAPINGIPSFVTMKGGDYFFAPSIAALKAIAAADLGANRQPAMGKFSAFLIGTPKLENQEELEKIGRQILCQGPKRIRLPREQNDGQLDDKPINFVLIGQHADVSQVLGSHSVSPGTPPAFSVAHYLEASRQITRGSTLLLAMDEGGPLDARRSLRLRIMRTAYDKLGWGKPEHDARIRRFICGEVGPIVHRVANAGRIDILQDLAFYISHRLVEEFAGIPGPAHFSELVVSLPFAKRYIMQLPADWLKDRSAEGVDPGYATMQIWSRFAFAEVIGNILDRRELTQVATQATGELLNHIDEKIVEERLRPTEYPDTFLQQLVKQGSMFPEVEESEYYNEVRTILADLVVTMSVNIALPFSKAIQAALHFGFNLAWIVKPLYKLPLPPSVPAAVASSYLDIFIYELLRLFPSAPAIYRRCEATTQLSSGPTIEKGEWVACLLPIAGQDPRAFPEPTEFSLGSGLPPHLARYGKYPRDPSKYLLFGPLNGVHHCWGRSLGKLVLAELFRTAARFPGLSRVAGPAGQTAELPSRMDYGLKLKFYPFDPNTMDG
jgi:Dyp-type peroxidase family